MPSMPIAKLRASPKEHAMQRKHARTCTSGAKVRFRHDIRHATASRDPRFTVMPSYKPFRMSCVCTSVSGWYRAWTAPAFPAFWAMPPSISAIFGDGDRLRRECLRTEPDKDSYDAQCYVSCPHGTCLASCHLVCLSRKEHTCAVLKERGIPSCLKDGRAVSNSRRCRRLYARNRAPEQV
jgi:hypothetical protein